MDHRLQMLMQNNLLWTARSENESAPQAAGAALHTADAIPFGIPAVDASLSEGGLLRGSTHELTVLQAIPAPGNPLAARLLSSVLIANCIQQLLTHSSCPSFSKKIFWISRHDFPSPFCLQNMFATIEQKFQLQEPLLTHCVFLKPASTQELLHVLDMLLGSPAVAALVAELPTIPFAQERRFAVRAKTHEIFTLFLREPQILKRASAAHSRWSLTPRVTSTESPVFRLKLEGKKGMQPMRRSWEIVFCDTIDTFHFTTLPPETAEQQDSLPLRQAS